jgi:hypothetical protein
MKYLVLLLSVYTVYSASLPSSKPTASAVEEGTGVSMPRSKRTASAVEEGNNWFKSFYSMFSEKGQSFSKVEDPKLSLLSEALDKLKENSAANPSSKPGADPARPEVNHPRPEDNPARPGANPSISVANPARPVAIPSRPQVNPLRPGANNPSPGFLPVENFFPINPSQPNIKDSPSTQQGSQASIPSLPFNPSPDFHPGQQIPSQPAPSFRPNFQNPNRPSTGSNPSPGSFPSPGSWPSIQTPSHPLFPNHPSPESGIPTRGPSNQIQPPTNPSVSNHNFWPSPSRPSPSSPSLPVSPSPPLPSTGGEFPTINNDFNRGDYVSWYRNQSIPEEYVPFPGISFEAPSYRLPKEECHTSKGEVGECLNPFDCGAEGGEPAGLCHQGFDAAHHIRSCCIFPSYCGYETNKEVSYLTSPDYPKPTTVGDDCNFKVDLLPEVCQLRLDFLEFEMKPMVEGVCEDDNSLFISSSEKIAMIPLRRLCGTISTDADMIDPLRTDIPHMYVNVDRDPSFMHGVQRVNIPNKSPVAPSVRLRLKVNGHPSRWNIRVSQIVCDGANLQAPMGCSQYYNMNSGNITSLNLQDGQYAKNLRWTSCIKRDPTACAVEYNLRSFSLGETKAGPGRLGYGLTCQDYIVINGEKTALCGGLNQPKRLVFPAKGPESFFFYSDNLYTKADVGYSIEYKHHLNCTDLPSFTYPTKK